MRRLLAGSLGVLVACCATTVAPAAVPVPGGQPEALLEKGAIGTYRFGVSIRRGPGRDGRRAPCVGIDLAPPKSPDTPRGRGEICGSTETGLLASSSTGVENRKKTVLAMVFGPSVRRVELTLGGRGVEVAPLKRLSRAKARKARIGNVRYAVLSFSGPFCLAHTTAYDVRGQVVRNSEEEPCPEG